MRTLTVAFVAALASVAPGFEVNPAYPWSARNNTIRVRRWGSPVDIPAMDPIAGVEALANVQGRASLVLLSVGARPGPSPPFRLPRPTRGTGLKQTTDDTGNAGCPRPPLAPTTSPLPVLLPAVDSKKRGKTAVRLAHRLPSRSQRNLQAGAGSDRPGRGRGRSPDQTGP